MLNYAPVRPIGRAGPCGRRAFVKARGMLYSSLANLEQNKTFADVDLSALRHNYRLLCEQVKPQNPSARLIAVVKADAYGHGIPACVPSLLEEGCDFFAVSCIDEAVAVEEACLACGKQADVLILGYTDPTLAKHLAEHGFLQSLLSKDYAEQLAREAKKAAVTVRVHIAVDTGMNRIGLCAKTEAQTERTATEIVTLFGCPHLRIEGMFTHFARADEEKESEGEARTELQSARYRKLCERLEKLGVRIPFHHTCNSIATVLRPQDHFDGVRVGILLYGAGPLSQARLPLRPVMKLRTVIAHLHTLEENGQVGYGGHFRPDRMRRIATLPIGYADGFIRAYSGCTVTVETDGGAKKATVVGTVCMDQCMIDVTDIDARVGDIVTVFGNDAKELSALAEHAGTIPYECLAMISPRVKLHYKN